MLVTIEKIQMHLLFRIKRTILNKMRKFIITHLIHRGKKITKGIGNIELTPAEMLRREQRAMRFQSDPVLASNNNNPRLKKKNITPIVWDLDSPGQPSTKPIVGTSTALEKPYLRLTSVNITKDAVYILITVIRHLIPQPYARLIFYKRHLSF